MERMRTARWGGMLVAAGVALVLSALTPLAWSQTATQNYVRGTEALEATLAAAQAAVAEAKRLAPSTAEGQYNLEGAERSMALARREFERHDWESARALAQRAMEHARAAGATGQR